MSRKLLLLTMLGLAGAAALPGCSHRKPPTPTAPAAANTSAATAPAAGNAATAPGAPAAAQPGSAQAEGGVPAHPDLVLLAGAAFDGCAAPTQPPPPPDGRVATEAQMLVAHRQTAQFNSATNVYLACLDKAEETFDRQYGQLLQLNGLQNVASLENRIHNKALDVDHAVADKFNQQLRIFKARGAAK